MASQRKRPKGFPNHVSLWREPEGLSHDGGLRSTTNRKLNQTREPRGLSPSGGLGDESAGNARPSAERFQSAILICIALRA